MKSTKVVLRYAKAFFQYSLECKKEEKLAKEMQQLYIAIEEHSNLEKFFSDPILSVEKKLKIKRNLFKSFSKEYPATLKLNKLNMAIVKGILKEGHKVASGFAKSSPYPQSSIKMQKPFFSINCPLENYQHFLLSFFL